MASFSYSSHFLKAMAAATVFQPVSIASALHLSEEDREPADDSHNATTPKLQHALIGEK